MKYAFLMLIASSSLLEEIEDTINQAEAILKHVSHVPHGLRKNTATIRCKFELKVPDVVTYRKPLHSVKQDGGGHDGRWVGAGSTVYAHYPIDGTCVNSNVTAIVAREDDHNPFFMVSLVYNIWCISKNVTRVVFLDECIPSAMTELWTIVYPGVELICVGDLAGSTLRTDTTIIAMSEYAGDLMQHLNDNNWVSPKNTRLREFVRVVVKNIHPGSSRGVIVSRRHTEKRRLGRIWANEKECARELHAEPVVYENLKFTDQVSVSMGAKTMIGMHGAGLVHALWLKPGSTLIEIFPKNKRRWGYRNIANMIGLRYVEYRGGQDTGNGKIVPMEWCRSYASSRVFDAVHINHETNIYMLRHKEYEGIVDEFHVFEGSITHRGEVKHSSIRSLLPANVHYHSIPKPPDYETCRTGSWKCETHDRAYVAETMAKLVGPNDVFITSDADEVASAKCLQKAVSTIHGCISLNTPVWKYSFNWKDTKAQNWKTLKVCRGVDTAVVISKNRYGRSGAQTSKYHTMPGVCGWHMSTFGSISDIRRKEMSIVEGVGRVHSIEETTRRANNGISLFSEKRLYTRQQPLTWPKIRKINNTWFNERFMSWPKMQKRRTMLKGFKNPFSGGGMSNSDRNILVPRFKLHNSYGNFITEGICRNNKKHKYCWSPKYWNVDERAEYEKMWNSAVIQKRENIHVDRPIVHFRCGDVPHSTFLASKDHHSVYDLPCVNDIRKLMSHANVTGPAWMIVGGHGGNRAECDTLAETYAVALNVTLLDRASVETDFVWLQSAPRVVGVLSSSFLFASRIGKLDTLFMPEMLSNVFNTKWSPFTFQKCAKFYK